MAIRIPENFPQSLKERLIRKLLQKRRAGSTVDEPSLGTGGDESSSADIVGQWLQEQPLLQESTQGISTRKARLVAKKKLSADEDVVIVDHLWITTYAKAADHLLNITNLLESLEFALLGRHGESAEVEEEEQTETSGEVIQLGSLHDLREYLGTQNPGIIVEELTDVTLDSCVIANEALSGIPTLLPKIEALSLQECGIVDWDVLASALQQCHRLKALWLNDNPIERSIPSLRVKVEALCPQLQILSRQFTKNYDLWAVRYIADVEPSGEITELDLSERGVKKLKPEVFQCLQQVKTLDIKANAFNSFEEDVLPALSLLPHLEKLAIDFHQVLRLEDDSVLATELIDPCTLRKVLPSVTILDSENEDSEGEGEDESLEERIERVMQAFWTVAKPVRLASGPDAFPELHWYVNDDPFNSVGHSSQPNFALGFAHDTEANVTFSVGWPLAPIEAGEEITVDFLPQLQSGRLAADILKEVWGVNTVEEAPERASTLLRVADTSSHTASIERKLTDQFPAVTCLEADTPLNIYTDMPVLNQYLSLPHVHFVDDPSQANIWWTVKQMEDEIAAEPRFINHLENEFNLDDKCELVRTVRQYNSNAFPPWLPKSFVMETESSEMVAAYKRRSEEASKTNIWIVKRGDLARGCDIAVTDSLRYILRASGMGNVVASEYIADVDLYRGRKYDLRYYVIVKALQPKLQMYVYDKLVVRPAVGSYRTDRLSFYEQHIHLTNLMLATTKGEDRIYVSEADLIADVTSRHPWLKWAELEQKIHRIFTELFNAAVVENSENRKALSQSSPRNVGLYGIDVLLDVKLNPHILEVNASPSPVTVSKLYPHFLDDVIQTAFFDKPAATFQLIGDFDKRIGS